MSALDRSHSGGPHRLGGRASRRLNAGVWARLLILSLLGNLALPGLAQAWVSGNAGLGNQMIAVCTSAGIRMISADQLTGPVTSPENASPGHCNACIGGGHEGLDTWATAVDWRQPARPASHGLAAVEPSARPPVVPGAQTRAPPAPLAPIS